MAGKRLRATGKWEYVFKRSGLLEKPLYFSFTNEAEGDAFAANLDRLLDRGIVPTELVAAAPVAVLRDLIRDYVRDAHPSDKDRSALGPIETDRGHTPLLAINVAWVDGWITKMKREDRLAPATIRGKVGALARCCDWGVRSGRLALPDQPFRSLPNGYSQYTEKDAALAGGARVDVDRERRLEPGEHERILAVLDKGVIPRSMRPLVLTEAAALRCLFILAQESAMRLREMFTLTLQQVDIPRRTVFLDRTKNGSKRQVPLTTVAVAALTAYLETRKGGSNLVFPWWNGSLNKKDLHDTSDYLSKLWASIFDAAGCPELRFHDLRHEATSRLFERTTMTDTEIMKITGHKSVRMLLRYANLRASSLSSKMW